MNQSASGAEPAQFRRAPQAPQTLTHEAQRWLVALPAEVRPLTLARQYARIVNRMVTLWTKPSGADQYLVSLMNDRRGNRRGFAAPIPAELERLRDYYEAEIAPNILPDDAPPATSSSGADMHMHAQALAAAHGERRSPAPGSTGAPRAAGGRRAEDLDAWIGRYLGGTPSR